MSYSWYVHILIRYELVVDMFGSFSSMSWFFISFCSMIWWYCPYPHPVLFSITILSFVLSWWCYTMVLLLMRIGPQSFPGRICFENITVPFPKINWLSEFWNFPQLWVPSFIWMFYLMWYSWSMGLDRDSNAVKIIKNDTKGCEKFWII